MTDDRVFVHQTDEPTPPPIEFDEQDDQDEIHPEADVAPDESSSDTAEDQSSSQKGSDPRHVRRIHIMQKVFSYSFCRDEEMQKQFIADNPELTDLITQIPQIDEEIQVYAPERPLSDINKVDLAILRSIVFEWKTSQVPQKVLINEGIELAKEFGTESSPRFVNGVLAKILQ